MTDTPLYSLLQTIDLGNGVAEHDNLLLKCMVKTPHFRELLFDKVDLVLGSKGSGKSSLFRIFGELLEDLLRDDHGTIVVTGVETRGEPIFKSYAPNFEKFSEGQFEDFWKAYLLSLVYNKLFHDPTVARLFESYEAELGTFKRLYASLGLIDVGRISTTTKLLKLVCAFTVAAVEGVKASWNMEDNEIVVGVDIRERIAQGYRDVAIPDLSKMDTVLCMDALSELGKAADKKIWIVLDHLDVVFRRRSSEESRALRALLRVLYAFGFENLRLKIFLRDDILDAISSDAVEPLAAVSHITARSGQNLKWTSDALCVLIMKRLAVNVSVAKMFELDEARLDDIDYSRERFQRIFAFKYVTQHAFDWIFSLLCDGRGVVTPRDLIDLLKRAFHIQSLWLERHPDKSEFMTIASVQQAHKELSKNRRETVLQTEFSHLMHWIRKLERNKDKYEKDEIHRLFDGDADKAISTLQAVGVIYFDQKKACYRVAKLYVPGLEVFATRARRNSRK